MIKHLSLLVTIICCASMQSQQYKPILPPTHIKTVQLFNPQTNDQNPLIEMGQEYLVLSFDDLSGGFKNYSYQLQYKNPDWTDANIFYSEYLTGYQTGFIRDYQPSFNTYQPYTHYRLQIPNQDMTPILSGNYELQVFEDGNKTPIFTKRFAIFEPNVQIGLRVERYLGGGKKNQRIEAQLQSPFDLTENPNGGKLNIIKNNNFNDALLDLNPQFMQPNSFTYNSQEIVFEGGYEHFWFDTKNIQIPSLTTQRVERIDSLFNTYLYYDAPFYEDTPYVENPDVNGAFYIRNTQIESNTTQANTEADYTWVHFGLEDFNDTANAHDIFIVGAFNDWQLHPDYQLHKNQDGIYEQKILLKQGYYNYTYAVQNKTTKAISYSKITGSYWQTENQYTALFYYQPWGNRYYRLVGVGEGYSRPNQR